MTSMRISVDQRDPGFDFYVKLRQAGHSVRVLLDGEELPGVVTADEDSGEVVVHRYTAQGKIVTQAGRTILERRRGRVIIIVDGSDEMRTLH